MRALAICCRDIEMAKMAKLGHFIECRPYWPNCQDLQMVHVKCMHGANKYLTVPNHTR